MRASSSPSRTTLPTNGDPPCRATSLLKSRGKSPSDEHTACGSAPAAPAPAREVRIAIDGERIGRRTGFLVNGARAELQNMRFLAFLKFVLAHRRAAGSWHSLADLGFARLADLPSRIRAAFVELVPEGFLVIEGDGQGGLRLNPAVTIESVSWDALGTHPDDAIRKIASDGRARR
jgi:hypothetical protein